MRHLDVRHCWLQEELRRWTLHNVKRVDRKHNASDMQSLRRRIAESLSYVGFLHNDGEEATLQRCQNDVETNACRPAYCKSHEHGMCRAHFFFFFFFFLKLIFFFFDFFFSLFFFF